MSAYVPELDAEAERIALENAKRLAKAAERRSRLAEVQAHRDRITAARTDAAWHSVLDEEIAEIRRRRLFGLPVDLDDVLATLEGLTKISPRFGNAERPERLVFEEPEE